MLSLHAFIGLVTHTTSSCWFLIKTYSAILICLEHSFWMVQQGSNPFNGFINAFDMYFKTQCAVVDQQLNDYLRSKDSQDWFITKHSPSKEELAECQQIVFNNLLCMASLCLQDCIADKIWIFSARPKSSTWYIGIWSLNVFFSVLIMHKNNWISSAQLMCFMSAF